METENLKNAYITGTILAKRTRVGKRFFGSLRMANRLYKDTTSMEHSVFIAGFNSVLNNYDIWINPNNGLVTGFHFKEVK